MHKLFRTTPVMLDTSVKRVLETRGTEAQRSQADVLLERLPELWTAASTRHFTARQIKLITRLIIDAKIAARREAVVDLLDKTQRLTHTLKAFSELPGTDTHPPKLPEKKKRR